MSTTLKVALLQLRAPDLEQHDLAFEAMLAATATADVNRARMRWHDIAPGTNTVRDRAVEAFAPLFQRAASVTG